MEGVIPFIFKVIAQYKEEGQASFGGLLSDSDEPSPVSSYVLLPGDSDGRHRDEIRDQSSSVRRPCTPRSSPPAPRGRLQSDARRCGGEREIWRSKWQDW
jgi:hypothetical protein